MLNLLLFFVFDNLLYQIIDKQFTITFLLGKTKTLILNKGQELSPVVPPNLTPLPLQQITPT
jgi:hypothetical protein